MRDTLTMQLPGKMLRRGMWLYVWRVETPKGERLYVGRTGDNSSPYATAPYTRMGQHLGFSEAANSLRRLLTESGIIPEDCESFELIAHGPIYEEIGLTKDQIRHEQMALHIPFRDKMAGLEKKLRDALHECGYDVLNIVNSKQVYDADEWNRVSEAFSQHFPKLKADKL